MQAEREKFLEELQCRLIEKTPEEQEAEMILAKFVQNAKEFAAELDSKQVLVNETNIYDMFVERNYSGKNDVFKLDRDEGMISLAIEVLMREREQKITEGR